MPKMKIFLLCLLLVLTIQACSAPAQAPTPQVVTIVVTSVVTAVPTGTDQSSAIGPTLTATPVPISEVSTDTPAPSPTATQASTATTAPSPTALPIVAAISPSPLPLPAVSNLPAQGPVGGDIDFGVVMSSQYLMRIKAKKHGTSTDGDGIDHVLFIVNKNLGDNVYSRTEKTAKYCIFGGGEPDCNPWPVTNGRYTWGAGGPAIVSGNYQVIIRIALKGDPTNESQWTFGITIKLPS